jgi:hypothetical protein
MRYVSGRICFVFVIAADEAGYSVRRDEQPSAASVRARGVWSPLFDLACLQLLHSGILATRLLCHCLVLEPMSKSANRALINFVQSFYRIHAGLLLRPGLTISFQNKKSVEELLLRVKKKFPLCRDSKQMMRSRLVAMLNRKAWRGTVIVFHLVTQFLHGWCVMLTIFPIHQERSRKSKKCDRRSESVERTVIFS